MTQMENQSVFALFAGIPFVRRALPIVRKLAAISILLGTITGAVRNRWARRRRRCQRD